MPNSPEVNPAMRTVLRRDADAYRLPGEELAEDEADANDADEEPDED